MHYRCKCYLIRCHSYSMKCTITYCLSFTKPNSIGTDNDFCVGQMTFTYNIANEQMKHLNIRFKFNLNNKQLETIE